MCSALWLRGFIHLSVILPFKIMSTRLSDVAQMTLSAIRAMQKLSCHVMRPLIGRAAFPHNKRNVLLSLYMELQSYCVVSCINFFHMLQQIK